MPDALTEAREVIRCPVGFASFEPLLGPIDCGVTLASLQWAILGGESGGKSRSCHIDWLRSLLKQCATAKVACFMKQWGSNPEGWGWLDQDGTSDNPPAEGQRLPNLLDQKGGNPAEWPADLRVRQFPDVSTPTAKGPRV